MSSSELLRSGEEEEEESKHYVIEISFDEVDDDQLKDKHKDNDKYKDEDKQDNTIQKTPSKVTDEDVGEPIVLVVEWRDLEGNDGESNLNFMCIK